MAEHGTWIKLDRGILGWEWYKDANTMRVFIHLLLKANVKGKMFKGCLVKRGQIAVSEQTLAAELHLSRQKVRTAMDHLVHTGELSSTAHGTFTLVTINNYDRYQSTESVMKQPPVRKKNVKKPKGKKEEPKEEPQPAQESEKYLPKEWELDIPEEFWGRFSSEDEWWSYAAEEGDEESVMN